MKFANFPLLNAANTCRKIIEVVIIKDRKTKKEIVGENYILTQLSRSNMGCGLKKEKLEMK